MLRSLAEPKQNDEYEMVLRRNLEREKLAEVIENKELVWIDAVDPSSEEIEWLSNLLDLHPLVVSDINRRDIRPALYSYPNQLFISLFQPTSGINELELREIHCVVLDHCFLTIRDSQSTSVGQSYDRIAQNQEAWVRGINYFLYLTIQMVVDAYYPILDRISIHLSELENQILVSRHVDSAQAQVFRTKQQLINLRQIIAPQRAVISKLLAEEIITRTNQDRDLFHHAYERTVRIYDTVDAQRDLSNNVLDLIRNQEATRLANTVSRLTIISMIFLPFTFLVGVFELNFITTDPVLEIPMSGGLLLILLLAMLAVSTVGLFWYFRRRDWI